LNRIGRGKKKI